jgi:hypothetical protein
VASKCAVYEVIGGAPVCGWAAGREVAKRSSVGSKRRVMVVYIDNIDIRIIAGNRGHPPLLWVRIAGLFILGAMRFVCKYR